LLFPETAVYRDRPKIRFSPPHTFYLDTAFRNLET
jgi:hypothetical protein